MGNVTKIELPHTGKSDVFVASNGEQTVISGTRQVTTIMPLLCGSDSRFADMAKDKPTHQLLIESTCNGPAELEIYVSVGPWTGIPKDTPLQQIGERKRPMLKIKIDNGTLVMIGQSEKTSDRLRLLEAPLKT